MRKNRSLTTAAGLVIPALKSLPVAALLLAGMTACSEENIPGENEAPDATESSVTVGNDPASQAGRITFYGAPGPRGSRAAEDFPSVGSEPTTVPTDLKEVKSFQEWNNGQPGSYVVQTCNWGSNQLTVGKWNNETNSNEAGVVYITGKVSGLDLIRGKGTVYVMSTGELELAGQLQIESEVTVKSFKDLKVAKDLKVQGSLLAKHNVEVGGDLNVEGTVVVKEDLTVEGKIQFNGGDKSRVKGKCISVGAEGDRAVDMSGGGELAIRSHLSCQGLYLGNSAQVYLWPNAMAEVDGTTAMTSGQCGFYFYSSEGKTGIHSLLNTAKFHVEGSADDPEYVGGLFKNELKIKYGELTNCQPAFKEKFIPSADDYYIPSDVKHGGCNPGNGKAEESKPFDPIAIIDGPTHSHNHLSATCIQPVGGRAYVSFHLNGEYKDNEENYVPTSEHMGCVEVYDVTEQNAQITSWLMNQDFDFNHMIVDDGKVYTVGDTKKYGATLGVINLDGNGVFGQYEMGAEGREDVMTYYNLYKKTEANRGSSGNCIIRDGEYFRVASYQGFQTLKVSDLKSDDAAFIPTTGSAKHIAQGGGYIVTLNLDEKGVEASTGTVTVYSAWGTQTDSFKTETITPIDGKNVIATDGTSIYVALGETGVAKYSMSGELQGEYSWIAEKLQSDPTYKGKPCANGLDVDDNYVYVANGGAGMIVLDKKDMKRVARYSHKYGEKDGEPLYYSANYVQKVGNLIYIAYGRNGLEIVKMREDKF